MCRLQVQPRLTGLMAMYIYLGFKILNHETPGIVYRIILVVRNKTNTYEEVKVWQTNKKSESD